MRRSLSLLPSPPHRSETTLGARLPASSSVGPAARHGTARTLSLPDYRPRQPSQARRRRGRACCLVKAGEVVARSGNRTSTLFRLHGRAERLAKFAHQIGALARLLHQHTAAVARIGRAARVGGGKNPRVNGDESVSIPTSFSDGTGPWLDRSCGEGNRPLILMVQDGCPATLCKRWPTAPAFGG